MINFHYPYIDPLATRLRDCGISIPDQWEIVFEDLGTAATIGAPVVEISEIIRFTEWLFARLYVVPPDYVIEGSIDE